MTPSVKVLGAAPLAAGSCQVVAEAGANHNNSVDRAIELAQAAAAAGAWGIKFQLYKAGSLVRRDSPKYWKDSFGTTSQYEAFKLSDQLDYDAYGAIARECSRLGIVFFATPFDFAAVEALERIDVPIYKVASGDITNKPLLEAVASTGKPIMLSTGASTIDEIRSAVDWLGLGDDKLVLLVCTLTYPTPDQDGHFARIETFRQEFSPYLVGMSDHTLGTLGGLVSSALGAVCIEKHYTLDKSLPDVPDHAMSVDPQELRELVRNCERGAVLRGSDWIGVRDSEVPARDNARRSVVAARDLPAGHTILESDLTYKRPGNGTPPGDADKFIGQRLTVAVSEDDLLFAAQVSGKGDA
jgi:sialic acid synthase SpsE